MVTKYKEVGKKYLNKIIQVDYTVPEIYHDSIEQIFFDKLQIFFNDNSIDYDAHHFFKVWNFNEFKGFFLTLRDIFRYINALQIRLPAIFEEIFIPDFLILEAIRVFDYFSYERLYASFKKSAIKKLSIQRILADDKEFSDKSNPYSRQLINLLLEKKELTNNQYDTEKRLFSLLYFERYFSLSVGSGDVSELFFNEILSNRSARADLLREISGSSKMRTFLRRLLNSNMQIVYPKVNSLLLIADILNCCKYVATIKDLQKNANELYEAINHLVITNKRPKDSFRFLLNYLRTSKEEEPTIFFGYIICKYYEYITTFIGKREYYEFIEEDPGRLEEPNLVCFNFYDEIIFLFSEYIQKISARKYIPWIGKGLNKEEIMPGNLFAKYFVSQYSGYFPNSYQSFLEKALKEKRSDIIIILFGYSFEINAVSNRPYAVNTMLAKSLVPKKEVMEKSLSLALADGEDFTEELRILRSFINYNKRNFIDYFSFSEEVALS